MNALLPHPNRGEKAVTPTPYRFRLYVVGGLPNSVRARENLEAICREHLAGNHEIEVVDFMDEPARALADGVIVTPTLMLLAPGPQRTVVGTLADHDAVARALELPRP